MLILHSYRFVNERATLSVHECAERTRVVVRMEGDILQFEEYEISLTADQWRLLCEFEPFDMKGGPSSVLRQVTLRDANYQDALELSQVAGGTLVHLTMRPAVGVDEDDLLVIALDQAEWDYLTGLDLIDAPGAVAPHRPHGRPGPDGVIH